MSNSLSGESKNNFISLFCSWWYPILDFVYPINCRICFCKLDYKSLDSGTICPDCWKKVEYLHLPYCLRCGHPAGDGFSEKCEECKKFRPVYFIKARGIAKYSGVLRKAIHFWKYGFKEEMKKPLVQIIEKYIQTNTELDSFDIIIPVPLHPIKFREREFNQAEILAEPFSDYFGIPVISDILYRTRYTRPQMELSADERFKNVEGLFALRNPAIVNGKKILLIDDVMTTGATVNACSKVLKEAGCLDIYIVVLARGQ